MTYNGLQKHGVEKRRAEVAKMMLEGWSRKEIINYCQDNYGVSIKTADRDMTLYNDEIAKKYLRKKDKVIEEHIARYEHIYKLYMDRGTEEQPNPYFDPEKASKMLEKIEKLMGKVESKVTYVENNTQINNNNNIVNVLNGKSVEELQALLEKLE